MIDLRVMCTTEACHVALLSAHIPFVQPHYLRVVDLRYGVRLGACIALSLRRRRAALLHRAIASTS